MRIPVIKGVIDRRILANYRIAPEAMARQLPPPFRPKVVHGYAIGGICLIRLKQVRPRFLPLPIGLRSENAAHRIAVEWDNDAGPREGVYIPRRDTDSRLNGLVGGRLFPGEHHHARFTVEESDDRFSVRMRSDDDATSVTVVARLADEFPAGSVFASLDEASAFFEAGSLGYSATRTSGRYDGLELQCRNWSVQPLLVEQVESSFFQDSEKFPQGSVAFDCALLMRGIQHEWQGRDDLCCTVAADAVAT
jgi:uncharacterized protein YqjF (DUF2071 family)